MWKRFVLCSMLAAAQYACNYDCGDDECMFTKMEWEEVKKLSPLPEVPPDPTNKYWNHEGAAMLGQKLFFETYYAGKIRVPSNGSNGGLGALDETRKVSCASCHIPQNYFIDTRTVPNNVSLGVAYTARNAPTLINTAYYTWHGWTGRQDSLWNQSSTSPESNDNTAGDRCDYGNMLSKFYREDYDAVFDEPLPAPTSTTSTDIFPAKCKPKSNAMAPDGPWEMMAGPDKQVVLGVMANYAKAIAAYEMKLVSRNAPFDKYVAGDENAISPEAKRGLRLFIGKAACNDCHLGPFFTDQEFHNIGVPQQGVNVPPEDLGRFTDLPRLLSHPLNSKSAFADGPSPISLEGLEPRETDKGTFRTPTLRGVAMTAPYFHTGYATTLEEVIWFYNEGGGASRFGGVKDPKMVSLGLDAREISELVAFLGTLTGEPVPAELLQNPN